MAERDEREQQSKSPDVILIAPKKINKLIGLSTGTLAERRVVQVDTAQIINDDFWLELATKLSGFEAASFWGTSQKSNRQFQNLFVEKAALIILGKDKIFSGFTISFFQPDSIHQITAPGERTDLQEYIEYLGLEEEFNMALGKIQLEAILNNQEPFETIWQSPNSIQNQP